MFAPKFFYVVCTSDALFDRGRAQEARWILHEQTAKRRLHEFGTQSVDFLLINSTSYGHLTSETSIMR